MKKRKQLWENLGLVRSKLAQSIAKDVEPQAFHRLIESRDKFGQTVDTLEKFIHTYV